MKRVRQNPIPAPARAPKLTTQNLTKCPKFHDGMHQWKMTGHGTLQGPYCMFCNARMYS